MGYQRHEILEQGMALQAAKKYPPQIQTEQLLQALGAVTSWGHDKLSLRFTARTLDNPGDPFAALVDFLDDVIEAECLERTRHK